MTVTRPPALVCGDGQRGREKVTDGSNGVRAGRRDKTSRPQRYAALDLGTNNCRLLVATPHKNGYRIIDAFSRIVRLGEGVARTGRLSDAAMDRTVAALAVCADKMKRRGVTKSRCIATEACRSAENGPNFIARVKAETGLDLDVITPKEEARLAVEGCQSLIDPASDAALIFDIGGGSTELSWLDLTEMKTGVRKRPRIVGWTSLPYGVVTLSERFGDGGATPDSYAAMTAEVEDVLKACGQGEGVREAFDEGRAHLLGTSGTVTSLAGLHLDLPRYDRSRVDGLWMTSEDILSCARRLQNMDLSARAASPCIGADRADLVISGCAILEAILRQWPSERLRVADRGLREGLLVQLSRKPRKRRYRGKRRRNAPKKDA